MATWLAKNGLALYGAVVATIALAPNILSYVHKIRAEKIRLRLTCEQSPEAPKPPDRYIVTVINDGSIPVPMAEAGVIDNQGRKHFAHNSIRGDSGFFPAWVNMFDTTIEPHSSRRGPVDILQTKRFKAVKAYAKRKDGREIRIRLKEYRWRRLLHWLP